MYARFLFALVIAMTITGISALGQVQATSRSVVCCSPGAERAMASVTRVRHHATLLPTVTVRPSAADLLALHGTSKANGLTALATVNLDQAGEVLAGRVRDRVSRASLLVPYYAFGGPRTRGTE